MQYVILLQIFFHHIFYFQRIKEILTNSLRFYQVYFLHYLC